MMRAMIDTVFFVVGAVVGGLLVGLVAGSRGNFDD